MTSKAFKKAVATTGTYKKDGEEKKRFANIGTLFQDDTDGRLSLKLDTVPVGEGWSGWVSFYDLDNKKEDDGAL